MEPPEQTASAAEQIPQQEDAQMPKAKDVPESSDTIDRASGGPGQGGGVANTGGPRGGKIMQPLKKRDRKVCSLIFFVQHLIFTHLNVMTRGRCSDEWCKDNPTGTITQFNCYWNTIKDTAAADVR